MIEETDYTFSAPAIIKHVIFSEKCTTNENIFLKAEWFYALVSNKSLSCSI